MASQLKICGVILAAGFSTRMGRDKALLPWPPSAHGATLLSAAIAALKHFTESLIVVAGANAAALAPIAETGGAILAVNPAPERGQFSSLQAGLRELLARSFNAAMITLVDCPPLSSTSLARLRDAFDDAISHGKWGVAPEHKGKRGHPLLANRALIDAFLAAPITSNAREVKHAHAHLIESVPVPDNVLAIDVNTPDQYEALSNRVEPR
jgi:CTP:molybdopterin cytidylyltransferase MocA